jgi:hypothetical protein
MTDLPTLIARVEAATGPDRDLDEAILAAVNPHKTGPYASWRAAASAFAWDTRVTASVDAALSLAEARGLNAADVLFDVLQAGWDGEARWSPADFARRIILALLRAQAERQAEGVGE